MVSNILGSGESFSCHVYSRVKSPNKEQFRTTMIEKSIAGQTKSSYNITITTNKIAIAISLMNSPIMKMKAEFVGFRRTRIDIFNANNAFGTVQAMPDNNAEIAALPPPNRAEIAATPIVATVCKSMIFFICFSQPTPANFSSARIIR